MVQEHQGEHESQWAAIGSIATKIGCTAETLRRWVRQAERDSGEREGDDRRAGADQGVGARGAGATPSQRNSAKGVGVFCHRWSPRLPKPSLHRGEGKTAVIDPDFDEAVASVPDGICRSNPGQAVALKAPGQKQVDSILV